jgi:hypothetical protein
MDSLKSPEVLSNVDMLNDPLVQAVRNTFHGSRRSICHFAQYRLRKLILICENGACQARIRASSRLGRGERAAIGGIAETIVEEAHRERLI